MSTAGVRTSALVAHPCGPRCHVGQNAIAPRSFTAGIKYKRCLEAPRQTGCRVALDSAAILATTQQAIAFIGFTGLETATGLTDKTIKGEEGRVSLPKQIAGSAGILGATAAVQLPATQLVGCCVGIIAAAVLMSDAIQRVQKVKGDISEFPGPKAWPVSAALIDFFILNTFLQAAREIVF